MSRLVSYVNSNTGTRVARVGGNYNSNDNYGMFYLNANNNASNTNGNYVKLDQNMPTGMKNQVLMHELLHAMFDFLGLDELRDDEQKVQMIATGLHQLFTQNEVFYTGKDESNG